MLTSANSKIGSLLKSIAIFFIFSSAQAKPIILTVAVELECGVGILQAPVLTLPAIDGVSYQATMLGLKRKDAPQIIKTIKNLNRPAVAKTSDENLEVGVLAECSSGTEAMISYTDAYQVCGPGEAISLGMLIPNCALDNSDHYHAVIRLTAIQHDQSSDPPELKQIESLIENLKKEPTVTTAALDLLIIAEKTAANEQQIAAEMAKIAHGLHETQEDFFCQPRITFKNYSN